MTDQTSERTLLPGERLYIKDPPGETVALYRPKGKDYTRLTASGTWVDPDEPPPDPDPDPIPTPPAGTLPRITPAYLATLPKSGAAYDAVVAASKGPRPDLANQESPGSAAMLARGLLGDKAGVALDLQACIATASKTGPDGRRTLNLARESQPIALAALLTGNDPLPAIAAVLAQTGLEDRGVGDGTLRTHAGSDPTNWGAHSRAAIAWFAVAGAIPKDEAAGHMVRYLVTGSGFGYKDDQQSWQPIPGRLVCIGPKSSNPDLDGVITNDAYRGGPPPNLVGDGANYTWEGFQGTVSAAIALDMLGYDVWSWGDRAILRAGLWMYRKGVPASGDDRWIGWVLRRVYGSEWPHPIETPTTPGKGLGFSDWLYR